MYTKQYNESPLFINQITRYLSYFYNIKSTSPYQTKFPEMSPEVKSAIEEFLYDYDLQLNYITKITFIQHKDWWYKLEALSENDINFYLPLLVLELSLYPKNFFKRINLKNLTLANTVVFHSDNYEKYRAALPDYEEDTLSLVFSCKERSIKYIRNVIHHELFHYFYFNFVGEYEDKDDLWEMFNPKGFEYTSKSGAWIQKEIISNDYQDYNSFVTQFSKTNLEEDKAEIFSYMGTSGYDVKDLLQREGVIGKYLYIRQLMEKFDKNEFKQGKGDFWNKAICFKKEICDKYYFI
jgi:hypothetical protein